MSKDNRHRDSKDNHKESRSSTGGHGLHLHLPSKKTSRSHSAGRVSPISFLTGHHRKQGQGNNGHSGNGNGSGGNGNGSGAGGLEYGDRGRERDSGEPRRSSSGNMAARNNSGGGGGGGSGGNLSRRTSSNPSSSQASPNSSPKSSRKGSFGVAQAPQVSYYVQ